MGVRPARGVAAPSVVLGLVRERALEEAPVADEQPADVERLEEPLVRIDRQGVGAFERGHASREPLGEPGSAGIGGVDVQPEALALGEVGKVGDRVDRAGVRRAGGTDDRERDAARGPVGRDRLRDRSGLEPEPLVGRDAHERVGREARDRQRPRDREVRLVRDVHPRAVELATARRPIEPAELAQPRVACDEQRP